MENAIAQLTAQLRKKGPVDRLVVERIEIQLGQEFPQDYKAFIAQHNGAAGPVGSASFLQLWRVEDIPDLNEGVPDLAPGLLLFGSDGGPTYYAFDTRASNAICFVEVPAIPMSLEAVRVLGYTFVEFLGYLYRQS
jgi:hypothetical protein